ncbi:hypothetical protein BGW80DRAFT_1388580, partial [Lactifluus volemus]
GREKSQPMVLWYDMRFSDAHGAISTRRQSEPQYPSTSRVLRAFADNAPNLTCLAIYQIIDYVRISA